MTILTRLLTGIGVSAKNAPLTYQELDQNFIEIVQGNLVALNVSSNVVLTNATINTSNIISSNINTSILYSANLVAPTITSANINSSILYSANVNSSNINSSNINSSVLYSANVNSSNINSPSLYSVNVLEMNNSMGIILKAANGTFYRLTVSNSGILNVSIP